MSLARIELATAFAILTFIGAGQSWAGPLEDAKSAYDKGDYSTALSLWRPLAEEGNAEAQRFIGILYENGHAVPRDGRQAVEWFRKAAAQGDAQAEYRLGARFVSGSDGLPEDAAQGLALMERAGENGYPRSFFWIGDYYRTGWHGIPENAAKAISWYRRAADLGDALAQSQLGLGYQYGRGVAKDIGQAISWYQKAAAQNNFPAELSLGNIYEYGEGVEVNKEAALCWYQKAAQADDRFFKTQAERAIVHLGKQISSGGDRGGCQ
jgi:uncharacterized protein